MIMSGRVIDRATYTAPAALDTVLIVKQLIRVEVVKRTLARLVVSNRWPWQPSWGS